MLAKTEAGMLEVEGPSVAPVESEETTDNRLGAQRNNPTPERTDKATIKAWVPFPSIAGARARVVSPTKRGHLEEVLVHGQRGRNQKTQ